MGHISLKVYLSLGCLAIVAYFLLGGLAQDAVYDLIGLSAVGAIFLGGRIHRPGRRLPWYALACGLLAFVVGDVIWAYYENFLDVSSPFPSAADGFYLAGYPLLAAGLLLAAGAETLRRDLTGLVDVAIITVATGLLMWVFFMEPYVEAPGLSLAERTISVFYPLASLALLAVMARLILMSGMRTPAGRFIVGGLAWLLVADLFYTGLILVDAYDGDSLINAGWLLSYVFFGAAGLHPSMRTVADTASGGAATIVRGRWALLGAALLTAPVALALHATLSDDLDASLIVAAWVVLITLVLVRMTGILRSRERAVSREALLRDASAALVGAPDRERVYAAALEAVLPFIGEAPGTRVSLWIGSSDKDVCVGAAGDGAEEIRGAETYVGDFPEWLRAPLLEGRTAELSPGQPSEVGDAFRFQTKLGAIFMVPLAVRGRFRGRVVVASDSELRGDIRSVLETLGFQVALALERTELGEELYRRRGEERFRTLVQNSSDVITIVGEDGLISYKSPAVERVFGYRSEDLLGLPLTDLVHREDVAAVRDFLQEAMELDGTTAPAEWRLCREDGSWLYVETIATNLLHDPDVRGLLLNTRDVTERRLAEEELRRSEERNEAIVRAYPDLMFRVSRDGEYLDFQANEDEELYVPREEIIGNNLRDTLPAEVAEGAHLCLERALRTGAMQIYEYQLPARAGLLDFEARFVPGGEDEALCVIRDVTERKRIEAELRVSEMRHRAVVETATDAIITMTGDGLIRSFNPAAERTFGYDAAEVLGGPLRILMPERFRAPHETGLREHLSGREAHVVGKGPMELAGLRGDGTEFPLELSLGEMREDGEILFTGIVRDVTERKAAERALTENERRFRQLFDQSTDALFIHDERGRIVDCNLEACRSLGYSRDEMLGFSVRDLATGLRFKDEDGEMAAEPTLWERAIAAEPGQMVGVHLGEHRRKDGVSFPVEVLVSPLQYGERKLILAAARDITERKRADEILRESERRLTEAQSIAGIGSWEWEIASDMVAWSDQQYLNFGLEPGEFEASFEGFLGLVHADDRDHIMRMTGEALRDPGSFEWEYRMVRSDGQVRYIHTRGRTFTDELGEPIRMVGTDHDITERKRAERIMTEQLRQAALRAEVGESLNRGGSISELLQRCTDAMVERVEEISFARAWTLGDGSDELVLEARSGGGPEPPMLKKSSSIIVQEVDRTREPFGVDDMHADTRILTRDWARSAGVNSIVGYPLVVECSLVGLVTTLSPAPLPEHAVQAVETMLDPISQGIRRKRAEEETRQLNEELEERVAQRTAALQESEERFKSLSEAAFEGISISLDGRIIESNRAASQIFGYELGENIGMDAGEFIAPEYRASTYASISSNSEERYETVGIRKDGSRFALEVQGRTILYKGKNARVTALRDITERKRAEEEIRALNESLERRVEERTAELDEAREAAEQANRAKSVFLANMSHEIRTPMNGVIGMSGLLLDTDLTREQREYAELVRNSGEGLLTLINDILDFSKIEAGRLDLEVVDFDLRNTLEETVALLAESAFGKGLELAYLVQPDVPDGLMGDPGRVSQVLTNLVGNAIKFTERGEVVLRASLAGREESEARIRFEVTDTGIGLTEAQISTLFQSFTQADASTTRRFGGTGLGLAISRQLVEMLGGEIGVRSEPGAGSTFWFELPFGLQPGGFRGRPARAGFQELQDLRVLIADANATSRELLLQNVLSWGMTGDAAEDARGALGLLRRAAQRGEPYDVAVLDEAELARTIRAEPALSSTGLVLMSYPGASGEDREDWNAVHLVRLMKPVRSSQLYEALAAVTVGAEEPERDETVQRPREPAGAPRAHVLLAEDNTVNQRLAVRMLEKLAYRVDVVSNGAEVLEALSRIPYDAVLMDCHMPEMDGYEATREIRSREQGFSRRTPIIALTASAMQGDREKALGAGMDDYVTKPVRKEVLEEALRPFSVHPEAPAETGGEGGGAVIPASEGPLDRGVIASLRELAEGEPGLLGVLVEAFLEDAPQRMRDIREALGREDAERVKVEAHTLKGSAGSMGAPVMAGLCEELQRAGDAGELSRSPELLEALLEEFERVRAALETELETG